MPNHDQVHPIDEEDAERPDRKSCAIPGKLCRQLPIGSEEVDAERGLNAVGKNHLQQTAQQIRDGYAGRNRTLTRKTPKDQTVRPAQYRAS